MTAATILVADNDEDNRDSLAEVLRTFGFEVESVCRSGVVERVRRGGIVLVILDLSSPVTSGADIAKLLQDTGTPIIATSAFPYWRIAGVLPNSIKRFFFKPFQLPELLRAVREMT